MSLVAWLCNGSERVASSTVTEVLIASDASWIINEVTAVFGDDTNIRVLHAGAEVRGAVAETTPDLVILDLQIGNMGGMATCIDLRLESGVGRLPHVPVMMLLDRAADVYLAQQSGAEAWLVKPLDAFRLRQAIRAVLAGEPYQEMTAAGVS
jgi:DNA-binding response OmpR family regulator